VEFGHAPDLTRRGIIVTDGALVNELQGVRDTAYNQCWFTISTDGEGIRKYEHVTAPV
jgi:hypothetical protein